MKNRQEAQKFRINGSFELENGPGSAEPKQGPDFIPHTTISGTLVSTSYHYPLAGLQVTAYLVPPVEQPLDGNSTPSSESEQIDLRLGESHSDEGGHFQIHFEESRTVQHAIMWISRSAKAAIVLSVTGEGGALHHRSGHLEIIEGQLAVTLVIKLPEAKVPDRMWSVLGERLQQAGITQVNLLVETLAAQNDRSLFNDWPLSVRHMALQKIEQAFLDPKLHLREVASPLPSFSELQLPGTLAAYREQVGEAIEQAEVQQALAELNSKVDSFSDLFAVDWPMAMDAFQQGNLGEAISKYGPEFVGGRDLVSEFFPTVESQLLRYRDYLREIWPNVYRFTWQLPTDWQKQALEQLRTRFHQDFFIRTTTQQPANELLIPILVSILTAPTGERWGFGIAPATIEPRDGQPARAFLDYLISRTGLSAQELGKRYRLDLTRSDSVLSSPVEENIATLQNFYRDGFQCGPEPAGVLPKVLSGLQPSFVPREVQGKAPFFLHFEEWLRQQEPFYAENYFDLSKTFVLENEGDVDLRLISAELDKAHKQYHLGQYQVARNAYETAKRSALGLIRNQKRLTGHAELERLQQVLAGRKRMRVRNRAELATFMKPSNRSDMSLVLLYYCLYTIPAGLADCYLAMGDYDLAVFYYGQTTRFAIGTARESDSGGYSPNSHFRRSYHDLALYHRGELPYTVDLTVQQFKGHNGWDTYPTEWEVGERQSRELTPIESLARNFVLPYVHPVERRYFRLRQANAMLELADALYRSNESANIQRSRELYKGVLFLHGERPPICPAWDRRGGGPKLAGGQTFGVLRPNPAGLSQILRARKGFFQIEAGLNYYGEDETLVPPLRYRALKTSADRIAALSRAAQQDFLFYMEKLENALIERMKLSNLLQKASLQSDIAQEQIKIAEHNVTIAQEQVTAVEAQIKAKKKEIEDGDSLFGQFSDFISGIKKTFESLPGDTQSAVISGFKSELTGKALAGKGMLGLGAGASIMTGFGIFGVAGFMSMSSLADAMNRRRSELRTLREKALPRAQEQVVSRQREVTIATYQQQIAQADSELARDLLQFEEHRFLNLNLWSNLAQIMRRLLRRYLEMGARAAWLAERALAYEQNRAIRIIRLDYFPAKLQGVTGADLLRTDLAELEATRIEGIRRSVPVKHTFSLVRDFPLQFGQLKQTGRCTFKTEEHSLIQAYPGTSGYRVRAVSLQISQSSLTYPVRGLLINQGVSLSSPSEPDEHVIVRPAEALPISEFNLSQDMTIYGLPNETLLTFEGSGLETFWELHLPAAANPAGYDGIEDVLLTLDLWAQHSPVRYARDLAALPEQVRRWIVVSGKQYQPGAIEALQGGGDPVVIEFDMEALQLPVQERDARLKNVAIFFVSSHPLDVAARFSATDSALDVDISFLQGIAMSNIPPTAEPAAPPPLPLNVLENISVRQHFRLTIDKSQNPGVVLSAVSDIVLCVEYEAKL